MLGWAARFASFKMYLSLLQTLMTDLNMRPFLFVPIQELKINKNLIGEVREDALVSCTHLRVLDLNHNLLQEQSIATQAWTHLKYVHPASRPELLQHFYFFKIIISGPSICHKRVDWSFLRNLNTSFFRRTHMHLCTYITGALTDTLYLNEQSCEGELEGNGLSACVCVCLNVSR